MGVFLGTLGFDLFSPDRHGRQSSRIVTGCKLSQIHRGLEGFENRFDLLGIGLQGRWKFGVYAGPLLILHQVFAI